jgi:hypothetical protein
VLERDDETEHANKSVSHVDGHRKEPDGMSRTALSWSTGLDWTGLDWTGLPLSLLNYGDATTAVYLLPYLHIVHVGFVHDLKVRGGERLGEFFGNGCFDGEHLLLLLLL